MTDSRSCVLLITMIIIVVLNQFGSLMTYYFLVVSYSEVIPKLLGEEGVPSRPLAY